MTLMELRSMYRQCFFWSNVWGHQRWRVDHVDSLQCHQPWLVGQSPNKIGGKPQPCWIPGGKLAPQMLGLKPHPPRRYPLKQWGSCIEYPDSVICTIRAPQMIGKSVFILTWPTNYKNWTIGGWVNIPQFFWGFQYPILPLYLHMLWADTPTTLLTVLNFKSHIHSNIQGWFKPHGFCI